MWNPNCSVREDMVHLEMLCAICKYRDLWSFLIETLNKAYAWRSLEGRRLSENLNMLYSLIDLHICQISFWLSVDVETRRSSRQRPEFVGLRPDTVSGCGFQLVNHLRGWLAGVCQLWKGKKGTNLVAVLWVHIWSLRKWTFLLR